MADVKNGRLSPAVVSITSRDGGDASGVPTYDDGMAAGDANADESRGHAHRAEPLRFRIVR